MTGNIQCKVVDADSHIIEPRDTWEKFVSAKDRPLALKIVDTAYPVDGFNCRRYTLKYKDRGLFDLGGVTPIGSEALKRESQKVRSDPSRQLQRQALSKIKSSLLSYEEQTPAAAFDSASRISWMNEVGIDSAFITPTWGSMWEQHLVSEPQAIHVNKEAYNRWLLDFCASDRKRLLPVAQLALHDLEWAETQIKNLRSQGVKMFVLRPVLYNNRPLGHPTFERFWSLLEDLDASAYFHIVGCGNGDEFFFDQAWFEDETTGQHSGATWSVMSHVPIMLTLTNMLRCGVFERHPRLRIAVVEQGAGWVAPWLRLLDELYQFSALRDKEYQNCKELPSSYIKRSVWFTALDSEELDTALDSIGESRIVFSSDYPHPESNALDPVREFIDRVPPANSPAIPQILGGNALEYLGN